jgi:hypothetical protein
MREDICASILAKTFNDRATALKKARIVLADAVYKIEMPADFLKMAAKCDERYFHRSSAFRVKDSRDNGHGFPMLNGACTAELSGVKAFPAYCYSYGDTSIKAVNAKSVELIETQMSAERVFLAEKETLKNRINGLLWSATTLEKLRQAAPELSDYLPEPEAKCTLPAIVVGTLVTDLMAAGLKIPAEK